MGGPTEAPGLHSTACGVRYASRLLVSVGEETRGVRANAKTRPTPRDMQLDTAAALRKQIAHSSAATQDARWLSAVASCLPAAMLQQFSV